MSIVKSSAVLSSYRHVLAVKVPHVENYKIGCDSKSLPL